MGACRDLYLVGGQQRGNALLREEWHQYCKALIVHLDLETGAAVPVAEHVTPPEYCAEDDPSITFKAGTLRGDRLFVPTETEILVYSLPDFRRLHYVTAPLLNDVHHATLSSRGTLLVANTGLDMVVELDLDGHVLREWSVLGEDIWKRFSKSVDYRTVFSTQPHQSHPNFVFEYGEELWVTRFKQKDLLCLTDPERRIEIGVERIHDGTVIGDRVYVTVVDGHVAVANLRSRKVEQVHDFSGIGHEAAHVLGWCRGILVLDKDRMIVGFSRLRPTKTVENLRWVRHKLGLAKFADVLPTRIALYDMRRRELCWETNLEDAGMAAVFSIHDATPYVRLS